VRAADGHIVRRRVKAGGGGLFSLFDTAAIFAFAPYTPASSTPAWSIGGSSTITGGCGSNGYIYGNGGPTITVGPLGLWGSNASMSGVTLGTGVSQFTRSAPFKTETADEAANLFRLGTTSGSGVVGWRPTSYDGSGNAIAPVDKYGHAVNSQAEIVTSAGVFYRTVVANEFLDAKNSEPVLSGSLWNGSGYKLRLKPGVYYFAKINLQNNDVVEVANDWYKADGTVLYDSDHNAINGPATVDDYNSDRNRITIFIDQIATAKGVSYEDSSIGSGLYSALQGAKSTSNNLRYRRPGNFRIYAKNIGNFSVSGSSSSPVEFNANVLHYNSGSTGYYGEMTLNSGCHLYGGLFAWTVNVSGGSIVEQYGTGIFGSSDPLTVVPTGGSTSGGGSGGSGGTGSGYGGWLWQELPTN
jgi:hypothetical protein